MSSRPPSAPTSPNPYSEIALRYLNAGLLPIPAKPSSKQPLFAHKPARGASAPQWSRQLARSNLRLFRDENFGVLCDGIFVVDFDDQTSYDTWYARFKDAFDSTVLCKTRKGWHVWFYRTPACEDASLTDGPLGFALHVDGTKGAKLPVDLKTRTAVASKLKAADGTVSVYHTPGFLSVPPSKHKVWVRSPFDHAIQPIPDALVDALVQAKANSWSKQPAAGAGTKRKRANDTQPALTLVPAAAPVTTTLATTSLPFWRPRFDLIKSLLVKAGFDERAISGVCEYSSLNANMSNAGYTNGILQFKYGGRCPVCGKDKHDNSFWVGVRADGSVRTRSTTCTSTKTLEWTKTALNAWTRAFIKESPGDVDQRVIDALKREYGFDVDDRKICFRDGRTYIGLKDGFWLALSTSIAERARGYPRLHFLGDKPWLWIETRVSIAVVV